MGGDHTRRKAHHVPFHIKIREDWNKLILIRRGSAKYQDWIFLFWTSFYLAVSSHPPKSFLLYFWLSLNKLNQPKQQCLSSKHALSLPQTHPLSIVGFLVRKQCLCCCHPFSSVFYVTWHPFLYLSKGKFSSLTFTWARCDIYWKGHPVRVTVCSLGGHYR